MLIFFSYFKGICNATERLITRVNTMQKGRLNGKSNATQIIVIFQRMYIHVGVVNVQSDHISHNDLNIS